MKWILCAKNTAGVECLHYLCERGDEVWPICTRDDDGTDGWQPSLRAAAERRGLPWERPRKINDPDLISRLAAFEAQALISIQYDQILKRRLFEAVGCPCLNFHFSLLPRHRGVAPIGWAILSGDSEAGVTLHHMVEDIDAGDVIAQRAVPIDPGETARELYDRLSRTAVELFVDCYPFAPNFLRRRLPQTSAGACYHRQGDFDFSQRRVDWSRPAAELHAWLRAMIFPPKQHPETSLGGRLLAITRISPELGDARTAPSGTVVAASPQAVDVMASDRTLRILGLAPAATPEDAANGSMASIAQGDRFE